MRKWRRGELKTNKNKIKFNRVYAKLINPRTHIRYTYATLIEAIPYHYEDLSLSFRLYDTAKSDFILLRSGRCIILIFQTESGIFITLRSLTANKLKFYRSRIGEEFKIIINNPREVETKFDKTS